MAHDDDKALAEVTDNKVQEASLFDQLAEAKKEIEDLKLQLMWQERSYE